MTLPADMRAYNLAITGQVILEKLRGCEGISFEAKEELVALVSLSIESSLTLSDDLDPYGATSGDLLGPAPVPSHLQRDNRPGGNIGIGGNVVPFRR